MQNLNRIKFLLSTNLTLIFCFFLFSSCSLFSISPDDEYQLSLEDTSLALETDFDEQKSASFSAQSLPDTLNNINIYNNYRVNNFIKMYTQKKKHIFIKGLQRAQLYFPILKRILKKYNLPQELIYLAIVESNLNPKAYSSAKALGLWQFMEKTGQQYGLNSNWWYDDRIDIEKATIAAAKYLKYLYKKFNHWELALAAYNSGEGRVSRAIRYAKKHNKKNDFWSLKLPRETRGYVPAFLAVANIFQNLTHYGFHAPTPLYSSELAIFPVEGGMKIDSIAQKIMITKTDLINFNPQLRRNITPPGEKYYLKIPIRVYQKPTPKKSKPNNIHHVTTAKKIVKPPKNNQPSSSKISLDLKKLFWKKKTPPQQKIKNRQNNRTHIIQKHETLFTIAMKYKVPPEKLLKFNQLEPKDFKIIGKTIKIPQKYKKNTPKTKPTTEIPPSQIESTTETPPSKIAPNEKILKNMWK